MKSRIVILFAGFAVLWSFLVLRGARLQFLPHEQLKARHERLFQTTIHLEARRGSILDRKGRELAVSVKANSLFADPREIKAPRATSRKLAKILGQNAKQLEAKLKNKNRRFVWLARKVDADTYAEVKALKIRGLSFIEESRRIYPNDKLLAPILGMVGSEGNGLEGLELSLNSNLTGQSKKMQVRRDARGRPLAVDGMMFTERPEGDEIQLTIDSEIQHELEKELENTVAEFAADQAYGVIMDPNTGEVVAMGMAPGFDANRAAKESPERRRNRNMTDTFEPGSVLKVVAVAGALEEGLIEPRTSIDTEDGRMKVGDRWIRESDQTHKWKSLTVSEVLAYSSNIGTTKIAMKLGDQKLRKYMELFGLGSRTGIELPGEAKGALLPLPWRDHLLANVSFGQGIAATPLQVASVYSAIANGGVWREPTIVKSKRDSETGELRPFHENSPNTRIVMKPETSQSLRLLLAGVTAIGGTGTNARVEGFPVGGKTGTAQKVNPNGRGYLQGGYISSFAGFLPANDPKYVIYIAVDHPKQRSFYGAQVAAPVFSRMATFISRLEGWAPILLAEKNLMPSDMRAAGKAQLASRIQDGRDPLAPYRSQRMFAKGTYVSKSELTQTHVPDLQNLTVGEVMKALNGEQVDLRVEGSGVVHQTWPRAGEPWQNKRKLVLQLKPFLRAEKAVAPDYYRSEATITNPSIRSF